MTAFRPALLATVLSALAACAGPGPMREVGSYNANAGTRADPAAVAACRTRADEVYAQQNRVDLSRRDSRDTPFSSQYVSGITSAGLGQRYAYDQMVSSCISGSAAGANTTDQGTGPTFAGPNKSQ
jgi:hypothetical protein